MKYKRTKWMLAEAMLCAAMLVCGSGCKEKPVVYPEGAITKCRTPNVTPFVKNDVKGVVLHHTA